MRVWLKVNWPGLCYWLAVWSAILLIVLLSGCQSVVTYRCPSLAPPTPKVVTALEQTGRTDPSSAAWVVDLEKHYEKCEAIQKLR